MIRKVLCFVLLTPLMILGIAKIYISPEDVFSEEAPLELSSSSAEVSSEYKQDNTFDFNLFWRIFFHFTDPGNQPSANSKGGAFFAALSAILGIFLLNGLLVSSIIGGIDHRKELWQNGEIRYKRKFLKNFAIIIGANELLPQIIQRLLTPVSDGCINNKCEKNNDYILLQTSRDPQQVRTELSSSLTKEQLSKVIIYKAHRDSEIELKNMYPLHCTEMYILGESTLVDGGYSVDGGESFHDALNMKCINIIATLINKERKQISNNCGATAIPLRSRRICKVLFEYQTTYSIFQFSDVPDFVKESLVFIPINRYDSWARKVFVDNCSDGDYDQSEIKYTPLDANGIVQEESDEHIHLVIVGMSKMGIALGIQAMLQAHYINFVGAKTQEQRKNRRTRISFIDTNADREMDFFKGRYENLFDLACYRYIDANACDEESLEFSSEDAWIDPMNSGKWDHISNNGENFIDLEIEFIKGAVESKGIRKYLENISDIKNSRVDTSKLTIAICLTRTHQAIAAALYMPIKVYEKAQEILVYQRESADIIKNLYLQNKKDMRYAKLRPFGMLHSDYLVDRTQYLKALIVNGTYDAETLEMLDGINMVDKTTYEGMRKSWNDLTLDKTFSNKYFVDSIGVKLRSLGLTMDSAVDNADKFKSPTLAIAEHNRWNVQQLIFGYSSTNAQDDRKCQELNRPCRLAAKKMEDWKEVNNWEQKSVDERKKIKSSNSEYIRLETELDAAKKPFKDLKNKLKERPTREHPNICDYDHLDDVDYGAKSYDMILNRCIPMIIEKVDFVNKGKKV